VKLRNPLQTSFRTSLIQDDGTSIFNDCLKNTTRSLDAVNRVGSERDYWFPRSPSYYGTVGPKKKKSELKPGGIE
jgi:hypothetical protein